MLLPISEGGLIGWLGRRFRATVATSSERTVSDKLATGDCRKMLLATPLRSGFGKAGADSAVVTEPRASASGNEKSKCRKWKRVSGCMSRSRGVLEGVGAGKRAGQKPGGRLESLAPLKGLQEVEIDVAAGEDDARTSNFARQLSEKHSRE